MCLLYLFTFPFFSSFFAKASVPSPPPPQVPVSMTRTSQLPLLYQSWPTEYDRRVKQLDFVLFFHTEIACAKQKYRKCILPKLSVYT
jgi:hypothetical protein